MRARRDGYLHRTAMTWLPIVLAVAIPLGYLYVLHWLDLYGTDRPKVVLQCVGWGLVAFLLSFLANRFTIDVLGYPVVFVSTRTAPFVEEVFKAGILFYLARRGRISYAVDGAIYGFASGIGFAAIENLRYIQKFPDNPLALVIVRDFSSALAHGTATAIAGIVLGAMVLSDRRHHAVIALVLGLAGAMALHYAWNNFANFSPFDRITTEWVLVGVGLAGAGLVAATILWALHRERTQLRTALGMKVGVSAEEASLVQHMDDLDELLDPIETRFGAAKREQVEELLHLEAQLGVQEDLEEKAEDPEMRAAWAADVAELRREVDRTRRQVGVYVMLYVRSIFPETAWSLWARLGQALARRGPSRTNPWTPLATRLGAPAAPGEGLYARTEAVLAARSSAAALTMDHVAALPEPMQQAVHWVMQETHATVDNIVAGLGHLEVDVREMLAELVDRGFLHQSEKDGRAAFRSRVSPGNKPVEKTHVWESAKRGKSDR